jgi:hypothetical protein
VLHVCGVTPALFGFGPPGTLPADAWYCVEHRQEGERAWSERYGTLSQEAAAPSPAMGRDGRP